MSERSDGRWFQVRPRRVPPELATDERGEECSLLAALTLVRVITLADDQGRVSGSAKTIRGMAFPMRDDVTVAKVERALGELADAGFVIRYEAGGRSYCQVARWWELQGSWARRAYPSAHPAPPGWVDRVFGVGGQGADSLPTDSEQTVSKVPPPSASTSPDTNADTSASNEESPSSPDSLVDLTVAREARTGTNGTRERSGRKGLAERVDAALYPYSLKPGQLEVLEAVLHASPIPEEVTLESLRQYAQAGELDGAIDGMRERFGVPS